MILVQETTDWDAPNHYYLLNDSKYKLYGYIKRGTKEMKIFSKALPFDKRYRKFKTIKTNLTFTK